MTTEVFYSTPSGSQWVAPLGVTSVRAFIVGGGGAGGSQYGGGGGAGGINIVDIAVSGGSAYTLFVGAAGNHSCFGGYYGYAGGAGGCGVYGNGTAGGCGGGAGGAGSPGGASQGYGGGACYSFYGGGGGGMGAAGSYGDTGIGGAGYYYALMGAYYAGGGGGGNVPGTGTGGVGGGGAGGFSSSTAGAANTGGGGGGCYNPGGSAGGSGIVILSYTINDPTTPTGVSATENNSSSVTVTWNASAYANNYLIVRDGSSYAWAGNTTSYVDTPEAPVITPGSAVASDGASLIQIDLILSGVSIAHGTQHYYQVYAYNSNTGVYSGLSGYDYGRRIAGALAYQWQRSADDSNSGFSNISGATAATHSDTTIPPGIGRFYKCVLSATGSVSQTSSADRGYRRSSGGLFVFNG